MKISDEELPLYLRRQAEHSLEDSRAIAAEAMELAADALDRMLQELQAARKVVERAEHYLDWEVDVRKWGLQDALTAYHALTQED